MSDTNIFRLNNGQAIELQGDEPALVARLLMHDLTGSMADLRSLLEELGEDPDVALEDLLVDEVVDDETTRGLA